MSCTIYEVRDELMAVLSAVSSRYQEALRPPASEASIQQLEAMLGVALPRDYREFLEMHDGSHGSTAFIAFCFFAVDDVVAKTKEVREQHVESQRDFNAGGWDSTKLMIGDSFVGWKLALDCSSGIPFVYAENNYALPLASSFLDYLAGLKDNLRSGKYQVVKGQVFMDEWGQRL